MTTITCDFCGKQLTDDFERNYLTIRRPRKDTIWTMSLFYEDTKREVCNACMDDLMGKIGIMENKLLLENTLKAQKKGKKKC